MKNGAGRKSKAEGSSGVNYRDSPACAFPGSGMESLGLNPETHAISGSRLESRLRHVRQKARDG